MTGEDTVTNRLRESRMYLMAALELLGQCHEPDGIYVDVKNARRSIAEGLMSVSAAESVLVHDLVRRVMSE